MAFFYFWSLESYLLKYNKLFKVSVSWKIRMFDFLKDQDIWRGRERGWGGSSSQNIRKGKYFFRGDFFLLSQYFTSCERPRFDSWWRSYQHISLSPHAAKSTQPSIFSRSVNEYQIIPVLTPGHRRWELLSRSTTGGMTDS